MVASEHSSPQCSAASFRPLQRGHRHWRAGFARRLLHRNTGPRTRHQIPPRGFHTTRKTHVFPTWHHASFRGHTMQSTFTGVSPMPCIGKMERFQPLPFAGAAPGCPTMARGHCTRPPFNFPVPPGRGIRDHALGPWPEKLGRWAAAAQRRKWPRIRGNASGKTTGFLRLS